MRSDLASGLGSAGAAFEGGFAVGRLGSHCSRHCGADVRDVIGSRMYVTRVPEEIDQNQLAMKNVRLFSGVVD